MTSRKVSLAETMVNQTASFIASYLVSLIVFGSIPSLGLLNVILLVVGFVRGYLVRRLFARYRSTSRGFAILETVISIATGFVVSMGVSAVVCSVFAIPVAASSQALVSFILIFISFARGYIVRRAFSRIS